MRRMSAAMAAKPYFKGPTRRTAGLSLSFRRKITRPVTGSRAAPKPRPSRRDWMKSFTAVRKLTARKIRMQAMR